MKLFVFNTIVDLNQEFKLKLLKMQRILLRVRVFCLSLHPNLVTTCGFL